MYALKVLWEVNPALLSICGFGSADSTPKLSLACNSHMVFLGYRIWLSEGPVTLLKWGEASKTH